MNWGNDGKCGQEQICSRNVKVKLADFRDPSDVAGGGEKGIKVEAEVSRLSGWMENTGLETDFGYMHGRGEDDEFSMYVLSIVLEIILDAKVRENWTATRKRMKLEHSLTIRANNKSRHYKTLTGKHRKNTL